MLPLRYTMSPGVTAWPASVRFPRSSSSDSHRVSPLAAQQAPGPYGVGQSKPAYSRHSDPIFSPMGPPSAVRPVTLSRRAVYSGAASSASHATRQLSVQAVGHAPTSPAPPHSPPAAAAAPSASAAAAAAAV